jgi:hypothetical protein
MPKASPSTRRRLLATHRHLGVVASLIVVLLAVTGVLLNHAERLALAEAPIRSEWLLDWYGLTPELAEGGFPLGFKLGEVWVSSLEGELYLAGQATVSLDSPAVGALALDSLLVVATRESLFLFSGDGDPEPIDRLGLASLPGPVQRIGVSGGGRIVVEVAGQIHLADAEILSWQLQPAKAVKHWSSPTLLPSEEQGRLLESYRGQGLTRFRVVSDLHSGRILGHYGYLVMDGAAGVLLLLTGTGIYNWLLSRRSRTSRVPAPRQREP